MKRRLLLRLIVPLMGTFFTSAGLGAQEPDSGLVVEDASTVRYSVLVLAPLEWLDEAKAEALVEAKLREARLRPQGLAADDTYSGPYLSVWVHQTLSGLLFDVTFDRPVHYSVGGHDRSVWAATWAATGPRTTVGNRESLGLHFLGSLIDEFIRDFRKANPYG